MKDFPDSCLIYTLPQRAVSLKNSSFAGQPNSARRFIICTLRLLVILSIYSFHFTLNRPCSRRSESDSGDPADRPTGWDRLTVLAFLFSFFFFCLSVPARRVTTAAGRRDLWQFIEDKTFRQSQRHLG